VRRQTAPTKERYVEIQSALAKAGHYDGEPNGKWDAKSVAAMKAFQEKNGLKVTGKLDALSLQKLGLGSEIAGLAPPRTASSEPRASQPPRSP
jgi:peptidoglycan hydrolase-like protein with peptidoglycan-binding domain